MHPPAVLGGQKSEVTGEVAYCGEEEAPQGDPEEEALPYADTTAQADRRRCSRPRARPRGGRAKLTGFEHGDDLGEGETAVELLERAEQAARAGAGEPGAAAAVGAVPAPPRRRRAVAAALASMLVAATVVAVQIARPSVPAPEPASIPPRDAPPATPVVRDAATLGTSTLLTPPPPSTRAQLLAALTARLPELARCPDAPARLTLAIDVGSRVALAEVQHDEVDPTLPFDRCVRPIVESLKLPTSRTATRHVVTLALDVAW